MPAFLQPGLFGGRTVCLFSNASSKITFGKTKKKPYEKGNGCFSKELELSVALYIVYILLKVHGRVTKKLEPRTYSIF